jgi:hypothetical protein
VSVACDGAEIAGFFPISPREVLKPRLTQANDS